MCLLVHDFYDVAVCIVVFLWVHLINYYNSHVCLYVYMYIVWVSVITHNSNHTFCYACGHVFLFMEY